MRRAIVGYFVGMFLIGVGASVWDAQQMMREFCDEAVEKQIRSAEE